MEQRHAGGDGALGQLDLADIALREDDLASRPRLSGTDQDKLTTLVAPDNALAEALREPVALVDLDQSRMIEDTGIQHGGQGVDRAGAADADRRGLADRVHLDVVRDRDSVDSPQRPSHPVLELCPFEGGPRGGRARPEVGLRAQEDLAVRPDVHGDADLRALVETSRQCDTHGVGPDETGHDRKQADTRFRVDLQEQLTRGQDHRMAHDGRVRRHADVGGIDP